MAELVFTSEREPNGPKGKLPLGGLLHDGTVQEAMELGSGAAGEATVLLPTILQMAAPK